MHIAVTRSGGFAGIEQSAEIDTQSLPGSAGATLAHLVAQAGIFERSAPKGDVGADQQRLTITVSDGGRSRTLTVIEDGSPENAPLSALADAVLQR